METPNIYFKSRGINHYHMAIPNGSISVCYDSIHVFSIPVTAGTTLELEPVSREEFLKVYTETLTRINNLLNQ